ncbi:hypothetical protein BN165_1130056 [Clostridioides difficile E1]|nr:hypothetical protein BN163_1230023 [Clostridioides difficile T5]CCK90896.1 hypothetical protein BN164_1110058 [Clostridioides difficile T20]CCK94583.1 hypothetical protein BN165_1130056 [Clostridioides difficile E1]
MQIYKKDFIIYLKYLIIIRDKGYDGYYRKLELYYFRMNN